MSMRRRRRSLIVPFVVLALLCVWALPAAAADPTLTITSPANGSTVSGSSVTVNWESTGVTIKPPAEAKSLEEGHYHAFLDITPDTAPGKPFPKGDRIVHTAETSATFNNVAPGEHTVTVMLGYSDHSAWQPVVEDKMTFNVTDGLGQVPPASGQPRPTHTGPLVLALVGSLAIVIGGVVLRRRSPIL